MQDLLDEPLMLKLAAAEQLKADGHHPFANHFYDRELDAEPWRRKQVLEREAFLRRVHSKGAVYGQ